MERQIQCKDCLADHVASTKTTLFCPPCSLFRAIQYLSTRPIRKRRCNICQKQFLPHRSGDKVYLCGTCLIPTLKYPHNVDCVFCKRTNPGPDRRVPVCFPCVRDPAVRQRIIEGLLKGQKRRKDANSHEARA